MLFPGYEREMATNVPFRIALKSTATSKEFLKRIRDDELSDLLKYPESKKRVKDIIQRHEDEEARKALPSIGPFQAPGPPTQPV
eukprot:1503790-Pyramimonas_sp.AAC.1